MPPAAGGSSPSRSRAFFSSDFSTKMVEKAFLTGPSFNRVGQNIPGPACGSQARRLPLFCAHGGSRFHGRTGTAVAGTFSASAGSLEGLNTDAGLFRWRSTPCRLPRPTLQKFCVFLQIYRVRFPMESLSFFAYLLKQVCLRLSSSRIAEIPHRYRRIQCTFAR